jgi:pseudouridine-5'-phosphate glycosidase
MKTITPVTESPVRGAIVRGEPIVVLESTVIAQGLPWPDNLETAQAMEAAVREAGAVPATIAVLEGVVRIGLSADDMERVARSALAPGTLQRPQSDAGRDARHPAFAKANRRDLGIHLARSSSAATTVSATLWLARRSGLDPCIMATGGLGGVHLGARESFDVSTDLDELARSDGSLVVCSGSKSILDLPATLEALETLGVAVVGYRTNEFPAFTTVTSGLPLEHRVESAAEAAALLRAHRELGVPGALVLANPVPAETAVDREVLETALADAIDQARRLGIAGKALTPFLLEAMREATGGRSLHANRALLVANARLAALVAVASRN